MMRVYSSILLSTLLLIGINSSAQASQTRFYFSQNSDIRDELQSAQANRQHTAQADGESSVAPERGSGR